MVPMPPSRAVSFVTLLLALSATAVDYYQNLLANGSNAAFRNRMYDFQGLNEVIGTADMLALGKEYEDKN